MEFFTITPTGRILSRFTSDIDTIDYKLPMHTKISLIYIFRVRFLDSICNYVVFVVLEFHCFD